MTGGGEASAAEVATSFPARLLGAIEELRKFSKLSEGRGRGKVKNFSEKGDLFLLSPIGLL